MLRNQIDLCLFPPLWLATSVTFLSLTILICKAGITITDHFLWIWLIVSTQQLFPRWLSGKEPSCQCRRCRFDPGSGRSPGEENDNPLQYSCLENLMDRGACWAQSMGLQESDIHDLATKPPPPPATHKLWMQKGTSAQRVLSQEPCTCCAFFQDVSPLSLRAPMSSHLRQQLLFFFLQSTGHSPIVGFLCLLSVSSTWCRVLSSVLTCGWILST